MKKPPKHREKVLAQRKRALVKTSFLELIGNLIDRTPDDAALIASVKRLFDISEVRLVRSFAPIRLVAQQSTLKAARRAKFRKTKAAWA